MAFCRRRYLQVKPAIKTPQRPSAYIPMTPPETPKPNQRLKMWKYNSRKRTTEERVKSFLQLQKKQHDLQVLQRRGLTVCGVGLPKNNLGNQLQISDKYIKDLDTDKNQSSPSFGTPLITFSLGNRDCSAVWISFLGKPINNQTLERLFVTCQQMVYQSFAEKLIEMELLDGTNEEEFTINCLVDPSSGEVLAVVEYVFMRTYLWVECLVVKKEYRNAGLGKMLLERVLYVAQMRQKQILLYSLPDVLSFYTNNGMQVSKKFAHPEHRGTFLTFPK
ncbi:hypothetical protein EDD86DRAFT_208460 [Gorgonomyces haynaldii]|nr:hypothetical protein EDD86DRAFT_208460 [Gorgonomyces haynaldii]